MCCHLNRGHQYHSRVNNKNAWFNIDSRCSSSISTVLCLYLSISFYLIHSALCVSAKYNRVFAMQELIVNIFQNGGEGKKAMDTGVETKNVWTALQENLQSEYGSQNNKAICFMKLVFNQKEHEEYNDRKAKTLSISHQNSDSLARIVGKNIKTIVEDMIDVLLHVFDEEIEEIEMHLVFAAFGYFFMNEFIPGLIRFGSKNSKILKLMHILCERSIVYQLIGRLKMRDILSRWNRAQLIQSQVLFGEAHDLSLELVMKVLKLILTKGRSYYKK